MNQILGLKPIFCTYLTIFYTKFFSATATAWKIVLVYRSCVHAISAFFKNIFLGLWNALKAGIRLTNGCSSEDQFLVGLEENIVLPTCCEEVGHYYDTKICLTRGVQQ